ncbi:MAG TPA: acetyl-CoA C-acyltransferase, partial [Thermoanaerobaculia bacterium]|nr:acetyl-CoA C-acyltransferase [Thermoanaerobaculia bacterium]
GGMAVKELVARYDVDGSAVDELIYGTVIPSVTRPNIAREVVFEAGLPMRVPASSVIMACASSNRAITDGAEKIALGLAHAIIAGGSECLSDVPILFSRQFAKRLVRLSRSKSVAARLKAFAGFRIGELAPNPPAIAEYTTELSMGQSAEKMAKENGISREAQDEFALRSHQRAAAGWDVGVLGPETFPVPIPPKYAAMETRDNNIRRDSTLEQLAKLKPVFDREYGSVTAGNSSPLTDGASAVLLMSEQRARAEGRRPLAFIRSWAYSALDPSDQLLQGPAYAAPIALERAGLQLSDMGRVEMHEAFAAQVLSNLQAFASAAFAREKLNRATPLGEIDPTILNLYGGSIAIGHPFAATGARIVTTLANELVRSGKQFGLLTVCAAGALGHAMVLENAG